MRLTESAIRRIIKEEAKRVIKEGDEYVGYMKDPVGLVERYMTHIEDLFQGDFDPEDAKIEASGLIDDLCENLKDSMHNWVMDTLHEAQAGRAEYDRDMEEDR